MLAADALAGQGRDLMARLRNRIRKADYFSDGELLRWPRDKRTTYSGLWALAEDSGCLEDDPLTWKVLLWPSPLDADISVEVLAQWRDELVADGKLIPYEAEGKRCLYISSFHKHELPRNPQQPDLPLPPWLICERPEGVSTDGKRWRRCSYRVVEDAVPTGKEVRTDSVQTPYRHRTDTVLGPRSCPVRSGPVEEHIGDRRALADVEKPSQSSTKRIVGVRPNYPDAFETWWDASGRTGSKSDAHVLWAEWRRRGATADELQLAVERYVRHCKTVDRKLMDGRTFLATTDRHRHDVNRWHEWLEDERHGSSNVAGDARLLDVATTAAEAFGLKGGGNGTAGRRAARDGGERQRAIEGGPDAGGCVAAGELGT